MAASKADIQNWFKRGVKTGARYMIVACNTFSHEDYPVYCEDAKTCIENRKELEGGEFTRIMETYNLKMNMEDQLDEPHANNYPGAPQKEKEQSNKLKVEIIPEHHSGLCITYIANGWQRNHLIPMTIEQIKDFAEQLNEEIARLEKES